MAYTGPRGSGYQSLATYLNLNREAGDAMGEKLAQDINERGKAAKGAIDQAKLNFGANLQSATPRYLAPGGLSDAMAGEARSEYKGPNSLADVADVGALEQQAQAAQERANLGTTDAGRAVMLQQQYTPANGGYSLGARSFDAMLAGRSQALTQATGAYGKMREYLTGAQSLTAGQAKEARSAAENTRKRYQADKERFASMPVEPPPMPAPPRKKPAPVERRNWHEN